MSCRRKQKRQQIEYRFAVFFLLEAPPGIGPGNESFADSCLTAWLWRRAHIHMYMEKEALMNSGLFLVERVTRLELATSTLARWRSTR